jgi:hypothetical protein
MTEAFECGIRNVEGGRKKRSPVKVGFLLLQTGFNFRLFRDRGAGLALDNFCQHIDHIMQTMIRPPGEVAFSWACEKPGASNTRRRIRKSLSG